MLQRNSNHCASSQWKCRSFGIRKPTLKERSMEVERGPSDAAVHAGSRCFIREGVVYDGDALSGRDRAE